MVSPSSGSPARAGTKRPTQLWSRLAQIYQKEIWQTALLKDRSPRGILYAVLRVVSITITVFFETRVASRAAALSFSSLLGLGPLIAIAVLVGGFMLGKNSDEMIAAQIGRIIVMIAPQLTIGGQSDGGREPPATPSQPAENQSTAPGLPHPKAGAGTLAPESPAPDARTKAKAPEDAGARNIAGKVDKDIVNFVGRIINSARSGTGGVFGAISFITVVLLLFSSIEDAFNDIWGVRTGRSILVRVVFYWTVLTLGAVIFFAAIALLGASAFLNVFNTTIGYLPGGQDLLEMLRWTLPLFSVTLLIALLSLVYRVIPNTRVFWSAAFAGALVVTTLLLLNNFIALLYVRRVILTRSLYGSVALPLVLMFGLYFFWLYLLIGGIVSYAVQNVHFRNSQAAWSTLPEQTRERLSLIVFLTICRRFRECLPPISASQLSAMLKVPTQLVNECLGRLEKLKLVTPLRPSPDETDGDGKYQPARPLNRLTLFDFKTLDETYGENVLGNSLEHIDPLLAKYDAALKQLGETDFFQKSLEELLAGHAIDESRPHFSGGEPRGT